MLLAADINPYIWATVKTAERQEARSLITSIVGGLRKKFATLEPTKGQSVTYNTFFAQSAKQG